MQTTQINPILFKDLAKFQPKQIEAWTLLQNENIKYLLYGGAAGGGKSYFLRWAAVGLGLYYHAKYGIRNIPIGLFSEDYPTLKDRQLLKIKNEFPDYLGRIKESRDEGLVFKANEQYGGFVILLRNLDDPSKYASTEFAAELVEELTKNPRETFDDLRFRLRHPGINDVKFVAATNPGGIGHAFVKKLWIKKDPHNPDPEEKSFYFLPAYLYDNEVLKGTGYEKQLDALPEHKRKAYRDGSWDIFAGQTFDEWTDRQHTVRPFKIPDEWTRYMAMDWGVNKPFSVGWYAQNPDGRTFLYRELYMNGDGFHEKFKVPLTPQRLARVITGINTKSKEDIRYCVSDPAMWNDAVTGKSVRHASTSGESVAERMIKNGVPMIKADNDRLNGLERYRQALALAPDGRPWYQVFTTCYDTIRTIPSLVYNERGNIEDVNTDGDDHCYDRDRYYFMSRPAAPPKLKPPPINKIQRALVQHHAKYLNKQDALYATDNW